MKYRRDASPAENLGVYAVLKKAYLEITNICNLSCSFCPGTKREKRFMSSEDFRFLAGRLRPHTDYLYLHLMGEPLLHPELEAILSPKRGELLLSSPAVHKLNISLQSFEANPAGELEKYIFSCAAFAKASGEAGKLCVLRLWNQNGLDSLNPQIESLLLPYFPKPWAESRGSLRLAERVYLEPGERFDWPDMEAQDRGESCFCYGLRDQVGVLCDGTVVPCCLDHEGDIPLGNLFRQELPEIMSTDRARNIYNGFSQRRATEPLCRRCGYSMRFT